jgi:hypothetical protein
VSKDVLSTEVQPWSWISEEAKEKEPSPTRRMRWKGEMGIDGDWLG